MMRQHLAMNSVVKMMVILSLVLAGSAAADVVVFVDGTRMSVQQYEVKRNVVVITTEDGKLRSVPRNAVDLEATERMNQRPSERPAAPAATSPPTSPPAPPTSPEPPAAAPAPTASPGVPPSVWTNDELGVSLVVPSPAWRVQNMVASFDVAAQLEKQAGEARATLALIRRAMRDYQGFREVIGEIESSVSATASYRLLGAGPLDLGPYTAHELRFVKEVSGLPVYNRIVIYYSEDLAYVLSLSCPESRLVENRDEFEALVRGLVIKKPQAQLTPRGKPAS